MVVVGGGWGEGGVYMLRTCGDLLGRDRCDPRCLSSPAHKEARSKNRQRRFSFFSLFFLLHLSFFVSVPQLNANSPGDSFLSVKDENERRKKEGGGGEGGRETCGEQDRLI